MRMSEQRLGGLLAICFALASPLAVAQAETAGSLEFSPKVVTEHKVKSLVGPSIQIDEAGIISLAWMEEDKDVRSVLYARSTAPGGPMGSPVRINRPEEIPYWRQEAPALTVAGDDVFVTWGLTHPKATPQQPLATELRLSRSTDGGKVFGPSVAVNDDPGVIQHTFDALHRDPAVYARMTERCMTRIAGMRKMIEDLLDLTRIESGQKSRELVGVDVCEVARTALDTALPSAQARGITLELHASAPIPMTADRGELEIIFNNLVSNAVKYNRDNGRVDVSVEAGAGRVRIVVKDTGIGIRQEDVAKLFNDFVRLKNEETRNVLGSGLGLSIVKKLAVMYGGEVSVTSEPGAGSAFSVTLNREAPA